MPTIVLKAHFDGTAIQLDESYQLARGAQLLVTVLSPTPDIDCDCLSGQGLARAYDDNEPEYSVANIQP